MSMQRWLRVVFQLIFGLSFILLSISSTLVVHTPTEDESIEAFETNYCGNVPTLSNQSLVLVDRTKSGCNVTKNVTGKIVFVPACAGCCLFSDLARNLDAAGAVGVIQGSELQLIAPPSLTIAFKLFCFAISDSDNLTIDIVNSLSTSEVVTVDVSLPVLEPKQKDALIALQTQANVNVWPVQLDPCAGRLSTVPSHPAWSGVACDTTGSVISSLQVPFPIQGSIPSSFCALQNLTSLQIQNDLTFHAIPYCNWTTMTSFVITGTSLATISANVFALPLLKTLDLSNNKLSGPLPPNWSTALSSITLRGNNFSGSIPQSVMQLPLTTLDLAQNQLVGIIPDFSLVTGTLDLSDNQLTNFSTLNQTCVVKNLLLGFNLLSKFPQNIANSLSNLNVLTINDNRLTSLPTLLSLSLVELDVSNNQLVGQLVIPSSGYLQTLLASDNQITAISGPPAVRLETLDLSSNNLSGTIQNVIPPTSVPNLLSLTLANNSFTAITTSTSFPYYDLLSADFSSNQIRGGLVWTLPSSLTTLDLSYNELTGIIPNTLLQYLHVCRLAGNNLSHGSSSLLPAQAVFTFDSLQRLVALGLECPTYSIKDVRQSQLVVEPSYHEYKLCRCSSGFYRQPNMTFCSECLSDAICPGSEDPLTPELNANIVAQFGYFPVPNADTPTMMLPCRFGVILVTDPNNPCNPNIQGVLANWGNNGTYSKFSCATGYADRLCSRCIAGWFRKEGRCLKCNNRPEYPLFLIAIVLIFLGACIFFVLRTPVDTSTTSINPDGWTFEPKQRVYDFIPLVLHFFQTSTIVLVKLDSLDVVQELNSVLVTTSFSTPQSGIGFECGLPAFQGFVTQYLAVVIFPPMLAVVLAIFFLARVIHRSSKGVEQQWNMTLYQYIYGIGSMFEAIHFPLVTYVLSVFECTTDPISGIQYFTDHPYLTCDSISPAGKVFPLLLYPIGLVGFFVGLGVYLHYAPSEVKESEPVLQSFAFFFVRFKPDRVASGVFFILVNLALSLVVGLLEANTDIFPTLVVLILIIDFFFVTVFQPYLQPRYNKVRSVNDLVALLLFVNNLIYSSQAQFPNRTASPAVIYVGLNVGMILFYCYHFYRLVKLHRTDVRLIRANSGGIEPHQPHSRKHLEMVDIKTRKHTNIDPPSTSNNETHAYAPVTTSPPAGENSVEVSSHSPLPIISENETSEFAGPKTAAPLVFTENPLADTSGSAFPASHESPPSPSSKDT